MAVVKPGDIGGEAVAKLWEFSHKLAMRFYWLYVWQVVASMFIIAFMPDSAEAAINLMQACNTVYVTVFAGYSLKAGVENALKIMNGTKPAAKAEPDEEKGGNG